MEAAQTSAIKTAPQEHGTLDQWLATMKGSTNPKPNGPKYRNSQGFIDTSLVSPLVYKDRFNGIKLKV
jgi:hypothetical protein